MAFIYTRESISKGLLILGWFCVVAGPLCLIGSGLSYLHVRAFVSKARRVQGKVIQLIEYTGGEHGPSYAPVFVFSDVNGTEHTIHSATYSRPPRQEVGEQVTVLYDPADPRDARIEGAVDLWLLPFVFGCIGTAYVIFAFLAIPLGRWLKRTAMPQRDP